MPGKPVATIGSMHICPLCNGTVPHIGGPVTGPGQPTVLINGKNVATMGDVCTCSGSPDTIVQGNPSILINGKPIACVGCKTAHGGSITIGDPTVMISSPTANSKTTMPLKKIPFPKITLLDNMGAAIIGQSNNLQQAKDAIKKIEDNAVENEDEPPLIYNLQWIKEEYIVRDSKVLKKVKLRASVRNMGDGQSISFKLYRYADKNSSSEGDKTDQVIVLTGTVQDKQVEVEWEVEDYDPDKNKNS